MFEQPLQVKTLDFYLHPATEVTIPAMAFMGSNSCALCARSIHECRTDAEAYSHDRAR